MSGPLDDELLTVEEVAERLRISRKTLDSWRRIKTGPRWIPIGRRTVYSRRDVDEWLKEQRESARSA